MDDAVHVRLDLVWLSWSEHCHLSYLFGLFEVDETALKLSIS
jgi:hypothetical protein